MRIFIQSFFLPFLLLVSVSPLFAANTTDITKSDFKIDLSQIDPVGSNKKISTGEEAVTTLLEKFADILLFMMPLIAGVSFIIAAYYYILSSGDSEKASQAKTIIKWNLVAIAVALFSYTLISLLAAMLEGTLL